MCTPPRSGRLVGEDASDRQRADQARGQLADDDESDRALPETVTRDVRPGIERPASEAQREDLGAELVGGDVDRSRLVVGPPGLLHHDHVGVEACAAR